ncbi:MAG: hypothetical protein ACLR7Z_14975 [Bilophila wadsworthia]
MALTCPLPPGSARRAPASHRASGTQEHVFTYEDFAARHRAAFHEEPGVKW